MDVKIFNEFSSQLISNFVSFESSFTGKSWKELFEAYEYLISQHSNLNIKSAPLLYVDIINKTNGYLFFCEANCKYYYVYN